MTIQFDLEKTAAAIAAHCASARASDPWGAEHQTAGTMLGVCDDLRRGVYELGDDAFTASFVGWTRHRGLLVEA